MRLIRDAPGVRKQLICGPVAQRRVSPGGPGRRLRAGHAAGPILLACLAATLWSGCGTASDADQARAATERFYRAVRQHDGPTACAQLSADTRKSLVKNAGSACASAVLKLPLRGTRAAAVRVYSTSAQVVLADGDTVFLSDTAQGWRIAAVGCSPRHGGPYECQEQA